MRRHGSAEPRPGLPGRRRPGRQPRVLLWSLALSTVVHVLFLGLRFTVRVPDGPAPAARSAAGVRWLAGSGAAAPPRPGDLRVADEPWEAAVDDESSSLPVDPEPPGPATEAREPGDPLALRIRPRAADARLWAAGGSVRERAWEDERAGLARGARAALDSARSADAAAARPADWTVPAAGDARWGASPGKLHLGRWALPYCGGRFGALDCGFGVPPGRADELRSRLGTLAEIEEQAAAAERDRILAVRLRAMRLVRDLERGARNPGGP